jgi:nitroreductase
MIENSTLELIDKRCSIRAYKSSPLTQEEIDTIIHSAFRAPTAGNMMHYSILMVKDQIKKDKLIKTCDNQPMIGKAPLVLIFLADMQRLYDFYKASGAEKYSKEQNSEYKTPKKSDLMLASCDALIAAQNAVIAAESMGIGSCYVGDMMENIEIHREMFNLPRWVFPITLLCFGYPKGENPKRRERFDKKFICFTDTYKRFSDEEFKEMFAHLEPHSMIAGANYPKNATNFGQALYIRKTGSDFSKEMERSVRVAVKDWCD